MPADLPPQRLSAAAGPEEPRGEPRDCYPRTIGSRCAPRTGFAWGDPGFRKTIIGVRSAGVLDRSSSGAPSLACDRSHRSDDEETT